MSQQLRDTHEYTALVGHLLLADILLTLATAVPFLVALAACTDTVRDLQGTCDKLGLASWSQCALNSAPLLGQDSCPDDVAGNAALPAAACLPGCPRTGIASCVGAWQGPGHQRGKQQGYRQIVDWQSL